MSFNKNSGYGMHLVSAVAQARATGGKIFMVAKTAQAAYNQLRDMFDVDPEGINRFAADLDTAIGYTTASRGDVILVAPGHTESITTAGAIALDVAGVSVLGLGVGNNRPVITFASTDNAASITVSADNCRIENIVGYCGDDGLTNAFNVTGDNAYLDIEWQDASATVEAATAVRLDTADNSYLKLKYKGFSGGNACVAPVILDTCVNSTIDIDFRGKASTSVVDMQDGASSDVFVSGYMFNSGTTDYSKDVTDTVTGSTWYVNIHDGAAGAQVSGGSGDALAAGDLSAIAAAVGDASARTNLQNLEDMLGVPDTAGASVYGVMVGTTAGVAAPQLGTKVTRAAADILDGGTTALFTVAGGKVLITAVVMENSVGATDGASNAKFIMNPTVGTDADMNAATAVGGSEVGSLWNCPLNGSGSLSTGKGGGGLLKVEMGWVAPEGTIDVNSTVDTNVTNSAVQSVELWYIPLDTGATVTST